MCCQHEQKGKLFKNEKNLLVIVSSSVVVLVALLESCCSQSIQQLESAENSATPPSIISSIIRNRPPILPCDSDKELQAGDEYFIQSPGFPKLKYPNSVQCAWKFKADSCNMGISCPDFKLTDFLCFDHFDIVDHNGTMVRYCGEKGPNDAFLSEQVSITFTSSAWFPSMGFRCRVVCRESEGQSPFPKTPLNSSDCHCGIANQKVQNGEPTDISLFPWQAGLVRKGGSSPVCGGTLINSRYVLTAAHCVQGRTPYNLEVIFNVTEFGGNGGQLMEIRRTVDNILKHKNFTSRLDYDAALVRLSEPLVITGSTGVSVLPVCLPTEEDLEKMYVGETATVLGWGLTSQDGETSPVLQRADVKVISNQECSEYYPTVTERMLCCHTPGTDACQGDSGGPLLVEGGKVEGYARNGVNSTDETYVRYVQIGIVSWGQGCGVKPGVYTRVTELMKWIATNSKDGSYCGNV